MTRKRFIKECMGFGIQRNEADKLATGVAALNHTVTFMIGSAFGEM